MKLAVVGSRLKFWRPELSNNRAKAQEFVSNKLDKLDKKHKFTEFVSGGEPTGADTLGENWARSRGFKEKNPGRNLIIYKPQERLIQKGGFGYAAFDRNKEIAARADKVVGFWGTENLKPTRGTGHTLQHAKSLGKDVTYVAVSKGNFPKGWRD